MHNVNTSAPHAYTLPWVECGNTFDHTMGEGQATHPAGNPTPSTPPPTYTDCHHSHNNSQLSPAAEMATRESSPTPRPGGAPSGTSEQGLETSSSGNYASSDGQARHVAHEVGPGADFRLLAASRVSRFPLFFLALLTMSTPALSSETTSQIRNGIFLIEGNHHPLQIRAVTERFDLRSRNL